MENSSDYFFQVLRDVMFLHSTSLPPASPSPQIKIGVFLSVQIHKGSLVCHHNIFFSKAYGCQTNGNSEMSFDILSVLLYSHASTSGNDASRQHGKECLTT